VIIEEFDLRGKPQREGWKNWIPVFTGMTQKENYGNCLDIIRSPINRPVVQGFMPVDPTGTKRVFVSFIQRPQGATLQFFLGFLFLAKQLQIMAFMDRH
jgi:hypothetical protein